VLTLIFFREDDILALLDKKMEDEIKKNSDFDIR
jgi:hypothetical protein